MTDQNKNFLVDLGNEKDNKLISSIEFKLDSTTNQILKIKEQLELIDSMSLSEDNSKILKDNLVFKSLRYHSEIENAQMETLLETIIFLGRENCIDLTCSSLYQSVEHCFFSAIKIHGFLISAYHDDEEMLDEIEKYCWVIQENDSSSSIVLYLKDHERTLCEETVSALFRCHSNLLGLAHSFLFTKEFKTKFLKYTEANQDSLKKIDDILN